MANEKSFSQPSNHSQNTIKDENNEDHVDGEGLSLKFHKHSTKPGTNTHPPTDSVKRESLNI